MTEVLIPPDIIPDEEYIELVDDGTVAFRPELGRSMEQSQQNYEPRLRVRQVFRSLRQSDRARMIAALRAASGKFNTVRAQVGRVFRGNGTFTELLTNNAFLNGTTGLTANACALSVADRVLRITASGSSATLISFRQTAGVTMTQGVPHVGRGFYTAFKTSASTLGPFFSDFGGLFNSNYAALASRLSTVMLVPGSTGGGAFFPTVLSSSGIQAGDYVDTAWSSVSRCALVDNGPNLLLQSDDFTTTWVNTRSTDAANSTTDPVGTSTADSLIEDATAANTHTISQGVTVSSAANDYCFHVALKAGTRTWAYVLLEHATGSASAWINLSTGALGSVTGGTDWANSRAFVRSLGNGWYSLALVSRKTSAATTVTARIGLSTGDAVQSYSGDGASLIYAWRATLAQSSVPTRLVQTTIDALPTGTAQTGSGLYLKGLPASISNIIAADGMVEVNGEGLQLKASLDSDAAGLGYLQFAPSLFRSPADNDPVIIAAPMPRFKLQESGRWNNQFGLYSDFELVMDQHYE